MTTSSRIDRLLDTVRSALREEFPDLLDSVEEYDRLWREFEERDSEGKLTEAAHRSRTKLRNPFRIEEAPEKTRNKVVKQEIRRAKQMHEAFGSAISAFALWYEHRRKLDEIDRFAEDRRQVPESRETHDPESIFSVGFPLLERLAAAKVSPSSIGRLPDDKVAFIADLIKAHAKDPNLKDPNNPWVLLINAGILEAPARHLDPDQQRVIVHAHALRSEHQNTFAAKTRRDLDLPAGFSEHFLAGAARIADLTRELTQGESSVYYQCAGLRIDREIELLAQVLDLNSEADRVRLASLVDLVRNARDWQQSDLSWTLKLHAVKNFIDAIEPHKKAKSYWVEDLIERLPELARKLSDSVDSIAAFNCLLREGFDLSEAKQAFDERAMNREREREQQQFQEDLADALRQGQSFKVSFPFVLFETFKHFETTDGPIWTPDSWIAAHGAPPGYEFDSGQGASTPAEDQVSDVPAADEASREHGEVSLYAAPFDEGAHEPYVDAEFELLNEEVGADDGVDWSGSEEIDKLKVVIECEAEELGVHPGVHGSGDRSEGISGAPLPTPASFERLDRGDDSPPPRAQQMPARLADQPAAPAPPGRNRKASPVRPENPPPTLFDFNDKDMQ